MRIKERFHVTLQEIFVHLFRNSIDHGFGQDSSENAISIRVDERDSIIYKDSGRGLALKSIVDRADKLGEKVDELQDEQIAMMIFKSGLSTKKEISEISGRGVGMDAVKEMVESIGGNIEIELISNRSSEGYRKFQLIIKIPNLGAH